MKKQPEITEATRQRIIDSFWEIFQNVEIERITVNQVSIVAEIHRSSFYRYFSDMYEVFEAFEYQLLDSINREIKNIQQDNGTQNLKVYTSRTSIMLTKYADKIYRLLNSTCSDGFKKKFMEGLRDNYKIMFGLSDSLDDVDYYVTFIGTMMLMNLEYWYERRDKYSFEEVTSKGQFLVGDGLKKLQGEA